jgi:hypothetical protein
MKARLLHFALLAGMTLAARVLAAVFGESTELFIAIAALVVAIDAKLNGTDL